MRANEFLNICGRTLEVIDVDGVLWATDNYWIVPYKGSIVERALRHWNLGGPGVYNVGDTIAKRLATTTSVDIVSELLNRATPEPMTLLRSGTHPMFVENVFSDERCAVFSTPDGDHAWLRTDFLRIVAGKNWAEADVSRSGPIPGKELVFRQFRVGPGFVMPVIVT